CSGRCGNQPGNTRPIRPRNCRSELIPIAACATASAISSASVTSGGLPARAGSRYSSANTYAATTRASRSVISSSDLEGTQDWKPFDIEAEDPCRPPPFHIKPLAAEDPLLQDVFYGSDGTRTRDLRRDRPVLAVAGRAGIAGDCCREQGFLTNMLRGSAGVG